MIILIKNMETKIQMPVQEFPQRSPQLSLRRWWEDGDAGSSSISQALNASTKEIFEMRGPVAENPV